MTTDYDGKWIKNKTVVRKKTYNICLIKVVMEIRIKAFCEDFDLTLTYDLENFQVCIELLSQAQYPLTTGILGVKYEQV